MSKVLVIHRAGMNMRGKAQLDVFELHFSNPARRGRVSDVATACRGVITGFGIYGYCLALKGIREAMAA